MYDLSGASDIGQREGRASSTRALEAPVLEHLFHVGGCCRLRHVVRVLERGNQPLAIAFLHCQSLQAFTGLRQSRWHMRACHRPPGMRNGDLRRQEAHVHLSEGESALMENVAE